MNYLILDYHKRLIRKRNIHFKKTNEIMFSTDHLHPLIVHFPVALITTGFVFEVFSLFFRREQCLSKTGFYLMVLGSLSAIAAWSSGHFFTEGPTQGEILKIFLKHETGALITLILIITGTIFRIWLMVKKKEETPLKWIAFVFYLLSFIAVTYTGFMGGTMVYNFMIGQ
jgi:uncharacterized membrane protein